MKRNILTMTLAMALAAPALAQAPLVSGLNQDAFKALQYAQMSPKPTGGWSEAQARVIRTSFIKDGNIDPAEAAALEALRKGTFEFTINGVQSATFKPKDMVIKGTLDAPGLALLTISTADLSDSVNQKAGESRVAFLIRRPEGWPEFAALVQKDPAARAEGRKLLAERWDKEYSAVVPGEGFERARLLLKSIVSTDVAKPGDLSPADRAAWRTFLQETAITAIKVHSVSYRPFEQLFDGPITAPVEADIANRIGLK